MLSGWVTWADPKDWNSGLLKIARLSHPAHAEAVDLDQDGQMDLVIADLGTDIATDAKVGSVVWLRRTGKRQFQKITLAKNLGRVADVQAADFNGDGKPDLVVAEFGAFGVGRVLYMENRSKPGNPLFVPLALTEVPGTITVPIVDLNHDGRPDFVALISQYRESIVGYINQGNNRFDSHVFWVGPHPAWGLSGLVPADVNGDGKMDFVVTHGDTVNDGVHFKPYQGIGWLENKGNYRFEMHEIATYYGAYSPKVVDVKGDGRLDIIAASFLPGADEPMQRKMNMPGIVWYEQVSPGFFQAHPFPDSACYHPALEVGELDADHNVYVIAGNLWLRPSSFSLQSAAVDIWRMRRLGANGKSRRQ
jgi:hypothetical protein